MGRLRPGASYIYENDGAGIYARESGSLDRILVGYHASRPDPDLQEFKEMIRRAEQDSDLRADLDKVLTYWKLIREER